jgi:hypothetical protein
VKQHHPAIQSETSSSSALSGLASTWFG